MTFDRDRVERLLADAAQRLTGEWLLVGGAAAAVWFAATRTTEDVDLFGLGGTNAERIAVMDLAEAVGLPVEVVNSTADYFVRRIADWRAHLVVLRTGPHATIYRPSATLFLLLKARRLSATDLADCVALIAHCRISGEAIDGARVREAIVTSAPTDDPDLAARRDALVAALA